MPKPRLFYDGNCPVCTNYVRLIRKKITPDEIDFVPTGGMSDDFQYASKTGAVTQGNAAIDAFSKDFPSILDYVWMLPPQYKVSGLKAAYKIGSTIRKIVNSGRKGCNCGKRKR
jgi:predicted DCC family thiol-disulfide oxidoreductase YuxK